LRGSSREIGTSTIFTSRSSVERTDRSFDPQFFPDPAGMAAQVKALTGAEMMVSLWPSVEDLSVNYLPLQEQGLLATTRDGTGITDSFAGVYTRLIDSTNPAAREFLCELLVSFTRILT
jgi:alpha-glucosidase (family GH31 glycosyl hydrolase)